MKGGVGDMIFTEEMLAEDEKRWHARDIVVELGYCGKYMRDRRDLTNLDIRFYAYIMRKAHDMLKKQEPPKNASISSAIECLLHPQDADDSDMAKAIDTAVRAMRSLMDKKPRVMTLDEVRAAEVVWLEQVGACVCAIKIQNFDSGTMSFAYAYNNYTSLVNIKPEYYGKVSRCWTSRPDEKVRAETAWQSDT